MEVTKEQLQGIKERADYIAGNPLSSFGDTTFASHISTTCEELLTGQKRMLDGTVEPL
jgi:hypothetical protein